MTAAHHTLDVYGAELYLITNRRDWTSLRRRLPFMELGPSEDASAGSSTFGVEMRAVGLPVPHLVVWLDLKRLEDPLDLVEIIAHEASHGANQILDYIGHDIRGVDEPHAYLVGFIARWIHQGLNPVTVKL